MDSLNPIKNPFGLTVIHSFFPSLMKEQVFFPLPKGNTSIHDVEPFSFYLCEDPVPSIMHPLLINHSFLLTFLSVQKQVKISSIL